MSKRDLSLLGYLGYKSVKNEPSKVGKELGECLIGWIFAMILMGVVYVIMTLFLSGTSIITNNIELIGILIGIVIIIAIVVIVSYVIYGGIGTYLEKRRQDKIKKEYSKEMNCQKCGKTINAKAIKCKYCGTYLRRGSKENNKIKQPYVQKHTLPTKTDK